MKRPVLKILSRNKIQTSIKGHNSATNNKKTTGSDPNLDLINIYAYKKFGEILYICWGKILTSIKGHNLVTNLQKMKITIPNINAYTKFGQILLICSEDIEQK